MTDFGDDIGVQCLVHQAPVRTLSGLNMMAQGQVICVWRPHLSVQNLGRLGNESVSSIRFLGVLSFQFFLESKQRIIAPNQVSRMRS